MDVWRPQIGPTMSSKHICTIGQMLAAFYTKRMLSIFSSVSEAIQHQIVVQEQLCKIIQNHSKLWQTLNEGGFVNSLECQFMFIIVATVVYSHQRYTKQISFFSMLHASPCCASLCIYVYCIDTFLTWLFPANQKKSISSEITKFPQSIAICNVLRHFSLCGASPSSLATAK